MKRNSLYHISPGVVEIREEQIPKLGSSQVLVRSLYSAISSGTEMLLYRGQFPADLALDENIPALSGGVKYPLKYGYSLVGEVAEVGEEVQGEWLGKRVFSFQPHTSHFHTETRYLQVVPEGLAAQDAVFLPNMETALGFVMDGAPVIGERAVIFGQGIVGLLTTALLAEFPLESMVTFDHYDLRRRTSLELGADQSLEPGANISVGKSDQAGDNAGLHWADLVFELTGNPEVINQAIEAAAYEGRIIVGSWYGRKKASLELGGWFHRGRIKIISSQVSHIGANFSGRWDKARRFNLAWEMIRQIKPSRLITHTIPIQEAQQAFNVLENDPGEALQVVFEY